MLVHRSEDDTQDHTVHLSVPTPHHPRLPPEDYCVPCVSLQRTTGMRLQPGVKLTMPLMRWHYRKLVSTLWLPWPLKSLQGPFLHVPQQSHFLHHVFFALSLSVSFSSFTRQFDSLPVATTTTAKTTSLWLLLFRRIGNSSKWVLFSCQLPLLFSGAIIPRTGWVIGELTLINWYNCNN